MKINFNGIEDLENGRYTGTIQSLAPHESFSDKLKIVIEIEHRGKKFDFTNLLLMRVYCGHPIYILLRSLGVDPLDMADFDTDKLIGVKVNFQIEHKKYGDNNFCLIREMTAVDPSVNINAEDTPSESAPESTVDGDKEIIIDFDSDISF